LSIFALAPTQADAYTPAGHRDDGEGKVMALLSTKKIRVVGGLFLMVLLAGGAAGWLQRGRLLKWYYLRGLQHATEADASTWIQRTASRGEAVVPELLDFMSRDNEQLRANARAALERIGNSLPQGEAEWTRCADRIVTAFPRLSVPGQRAVLALTADWLRPAAQPSAAAIRLGGRMLNAAAASSDATVRGSALDIAAALLASLPTGDMLADCRNLACTCFKDTDSRNRRRAVHLALYPALEILTDVAPLVRDPDFEVRRAAVLAVGTSRTAISDERLAVALHDIDPEVRRLCEKALLGRGLSHRHIHLARLITDGRPAVRLQVLKHLREDSDLDIAVWLRLLSQDGAESVRLAAIRAAAELPVFELDDRLEEMAAHDPSPTVSIWAKYYSKSLKQRQANNAAP
jgi:HEAT repeat protein